MGKNQYSKIKSPGGGSGQQYPEIDTDAREKTREAITSIMKPMRKAKKNLERSMKGKK